VVACEFAFIRELAHAGKVKQGRFIARRASLDAAPAAR